MGNKYDIVAVFVELGLDHDKLIAKLDEITLCSQHQEIDNKSSVPDLK